MSKESNGTFHVADQCRKNPPDMVTGNPVIKEKEEIAIPFQEMNVSTGNHIVLSFAEQGLKQLNEWIASCTGRNGYHPDLISDR
jgi:hypothetical protein